MGLLSRIFRKLSGESLVDEIMPLEVFEFDELTIKGHYVEDGFIKGKAYRKGILVAEGTFFEGILHGVGKAYVDFTHYTNYTRYGHQKATIRLKFEGNFVHGILNGQGKEYFVNGNIRYEGNFANGSWSGQGKEYNNEKILRREGIFYVPNAENYTYSCLKSGKTYNENGVLKYSGEFKGEKLNGEGQEYYDDGNLKYEGIFYYGKILSGKYYDIQGNLRHEGEFNNGIPKGKTND